VVSFQCYVNLRTEIYIEGQILRSKTSSFKARNSTLRYWHFVSCFPPPLPRKIILTLALSWPSWPKEKDIQRKWWSSLSGIEIHRRSNRSSCFFFLVCRLNQTSLGQNSNDAIYVGGLTQTSIHPNRIPDFESRNLWCLLTKSCWNINRGKMLRILV